MIILLGNTSGTSLLIKDKMEDFLSLIENSENTDLKKNRELLKILKSVSRNERLLLLSDSEIRNFPINKLILSLDDVLLGFNEKCPYIKYALSNKYIWFTSISALILYSGYTPIYLRHAKIIPGSSEIIKPINFLLMTSSVTFTSYFAFVTMLAISGRTSFYEVLNKLADETRIKHSKKMVEYLNVPQNTLLFDHLTKNNRIFAPLLEYYSNPNFIANYTMENIDEFPMNNIDAGIEDDINFCPSYEGFNTEPAEIKKSIVPLPVLLQLVILFGPFPRPVKTCSHLMVLSHKGFKLGKEFFNSRKRAKIEKARRNLIEQFN